MNEAISAALENVATRNELVGDDLTIPEVTSQVEQDGMKLSDLLSNQFDQPVMAADPAMLSVASSVGPKNLGDVLLKRLDVIGNNFTKNIQRTHKLLDNLPSELRVQDLLKLQLEMASISLEVELVGKGVQKAVQHVDQLTKLQ